MTLCPMKMASDDFQKHMVLAKKVYYSARAHGIGCGLMLIQRDAAGIVKHDPPEQSLLPVDRIAGGHFGIDFARYASSGRFDEQAARSQVTCLLSNHPVSMKTFLERTPVDHAAAFEAAQMCYPAKWSVFVGNLPSKFDNATLLTAVLEEFSIYGPVFGTIHRDGGARRGITMPWVILQFTNEAHALFAAKEVFNPSWPCTKILGRLVRVQPANAPRSVFVTRKDGSMLST